MRMGRALVVLLILGVFSVEIAPLVAEVHACPINIQNMMMYSLARHNFEEAEKMAAMINKMIHDVQEGSLTDAQKAEFEKAKKLFEEGQKRIEDGIRYLGGCNVNANTAFCDALRKFGEAFEILRNLPPHNQ